MTIWSWLFGRSRAGAPPAAERGAAAPGKQPIPLPTEPFVFECRVCHKVFEARRRRPLCPECDSPDVELMSA